MSQVMLYPSAVAMDAATDWLDRNCGTDSTIPCVMVFGELGSPDHPWAQCVRVVQEDPLETVLTNGLTAKAKAMMTAAAETCFAGRPVDVEDLDEPDIPAAAGTVNGDWVIGVSAIGIPPQGMRQILAFVKDALITNARLPQPVEATAAL